MAIHGDRDIAVPLSTGRSAARIAGGQLVVVEGGTHSWLLKDPETFPAILRESMASPMGQQGRDSMFRKAGIDSRRMAGNVSGSFSSHEWVPPSTTTS